MQDLSGAAEAHPGAVEALLRAVEAHPGGVQAHSGAVQAHPELWRLILETWRICKTGSGYSKKQDLNPHQSEKKGSDPDPKLSVNLNQNKRVK